MPRFRFHTVVTGSLVAPDLDSAMLAAEELVSVGGAQEMQCLDTQVHEVTHSRFVQQVGSAHVQLELFTMPRIES